jgi:cell division protein FtsB
LQVVPKNVVSAAEPGLSGMRRDFLSYIDFSPALSVLAVVAIIALVGIIYLGQVTAVTNANYTLQALQTEHTDLLRQREDLQLQIARAQSLSNIERQARDRLKMVPIGDRYEYIVVPGGPIQPMPATPTAAPDAGTGGQGAPSEQAEQQSP